MKLLRRLKPLSLLITKIKLTIFVNLEQFITIDCTFARYLTTNQKKLYEKIIVIDAYSGHVNDHELQ